MRYDTELGKFVRAHRDTVMINDLIFTPQGMCWAAVKDQGVVCCQIKNDTTLEQIEIYRDQVYNSLESPKCLEIDQEGTVWVGSGTGVTLLKKRFDGQRDVVFLNYHDGLLPGNYDRINLLFHRDTMWAATLHGLMYFIPSSFQTLPELKATFASILVNGNQLESDTRNIELPWHGILAINYLSASPADAGKIKYEISISGPGMDTTWVTTERSLTLNQLSSGHYQISVRVNNGTGVWQSEPAVLNAYVRSFWVSPRVLGLGAVAVGLLFLLWMWLTIRRERERRHEAEKLAEHEKITNGLHQQLNDMRLKHTEVFDLSHRQNMSTHIMQHLWHNAYALNCAGQHEATNNYLLRLRQFYGLATEIGKNLFVTLQTEKRFLDEYLSLEGSRLPNLKSAVEIVTNDPNHVYEDEPGMLKIPAFMLQTIVENAIRYAFNGKPDQWEVHVWLKPDAQTQTITCIVEDNGIGIDAVQTMASNPWKSTSYGFESIRRRLENFNSGLAEHAHLHPDNDIAPASLKVEACHPENLKYPGTKITITLPDSLDTWALEFFKHG
ncbi:MAG: hypothetical protein JNJ57_20820 [Saprospiraceae bacterium]|nr:hypothetical protein [Saprospiraceae bacterium]